MLELISWCIGWWNALHAGLSSPSPTALHGLVGNSLLRKLFLRARWSLWFIQFLDSPSGQDSGRSDVSDSADSYLSGCECPDSLCDGANKVWSHAHWSPGSGEMSASLGSHRSLRTGLSILGVLRLPQNWLVWRKMSRECEGNFSCA